MSTVTRDKWQPPANIDEHPLRYTPLATAIERIIIRRLHLRRIDGYTIETALEIADAIHAQEKGIDSAVQAMRDRCVQIVREEFDIWAQTKGVRPGAMIGVILHRIREAAAPPATNLLNSRATGAQPAESDALREALGKAWVRYVELFGDQPHGTTKQLDALVALFPAAKADSQEDNVK